MASTDSTTAPGAALALDTVVAPGSTGTSPAQRLASTEYLDQPRFHRRLTLPATNDHGELTVTYAVAGAQSDTAHTVLFIGGMMGGRYLATLGDFVAEKLGLRLVVTDR